jgi:hypothetical protein
MSQGGVTGPGYERRADLASRSIIMSDSEPTRRPRRSQRERKKVTHFTSGPSISSYTLPLDVQLRLCPGSSQKRKRDRDESNDDQDGHTEGHLSDPGDPPSPDENEQGDYGAQKPRGRPVAPPKKKGKTKPLKRTRVTKPGDAREASARKLNKSQTNGDASNANRIPQDFKINTDNALFSAS